MTWIYVQKTGLLALLRDTTIERVWTGYSGHGEGLNNPDLEYVRNVGPIPSGVYLMGKPRHGGKLGAHVIPLQPVQPEKLRGRAGFFIHGDNAAADRSASHGCPIFPFLIRQQLGAAIAEGNNVLLVVRQLPTPENWRAA